MSMGPIAALKLRRVVENVARCLAIEAAVAARAVDLRGIATSERLSRVYEAVRRYVAPWTGDRSLSEELEALAEAMMRGEVREAAGLAEELGGWG